MNILNESSISNFFGRLPGSKSIKDYFGAEETENHHARERFGYRDVELTSIPEDYSSVQMLGIYFEQYLMNKAFRIRKYMEMAYSSEMGWMVDMLCDDSMVPDSDGHVAHLDIKPHVPSYVKEYMIEAWDYMYQEMFNFDEIAWDLYKKFIIEAEIFIKLIYEYDKTGNKTDIIDFRVIPAYNCLPVYKGEMIVKYAVGDVTDQVRQTNGAFSSLNHEEYFKKGTVELVDVDDMIYVNYGDYGETKADIRGYLERCVRPYNMYRHLIDALVTYRIIRAPQRRLWNIAVPKGGAKRGMQFLNSVIEKYKKEIKFDPTTGAMDSSRNHQSMQEDIWLAKVEGSEGSSVSTVDGDMNLGDLNDVNIIRGNLYRAGNIPSSRWIDPTTKVATYGNPGEIPQEELNWSRFLDRNKNRFRYLLINTFIRVLEVRGLNDEFIDTKLFTVRFNRQNEFQMIRELEILEKRTTILNQYTQMMFTKENPNGLFAPEIVLKEYYKMPVELYDRNMELIEEMKASMKQNAKDQAAAPQQDMGMGMDAGVGGFDVGGEQFGQGMGMGAGMGGQDMGMGGMDMGMGAGGGMGVQTAGQALPGAEDIIQL